METQPTNINALQVPFLQLLKFTLKLAFASIPAIVIVYLAIAWCHAIFGDALLKI